MISNLVLIPSQNYIYRIILILGIIIYTPKHTTLKHDHSTSIYNRQVLHNMQINARIVSVCCQFSIARFCVNAIPQSLFQRILRLNKKVFALYNTLTLNFLFDFLTMSSVTTDQDQAIYFFDLQSFIVWQCQTNRVQDLTRHFIDYSDPNHVMSADYVSNLGSHV